MTMHRSYLILISGGVLLVIGIALMLSLNAVFNENFPNSSLLIEGDTINPGNSITTVLALQSDEELTLAISVMPRDTLIVAEIKQENGTAVSEFAFRSQAITPLGKLNAGNYFITIVNGGEQSVTVFAIITSDEVGEEMEIFSIFVGTGITGILLIVIGFLVIIVGTILVILNLKKRRKKN